LLRQNDENIKLCYSFIKTEIKKHHSEIRYSALQICDELFMRSHIFRQLLLDDFQLLFELALETNRSNLLPPPKEASIKLKQLAAQLIKKWYLKFGSEYKLLNLGFKYLKDTKRIDFETFNTLTLAERKNREEVNKRKEFFLNQECIQFVNEMKGRIKQ
jgi:UV-stimulated scaffold protein A